MKTKWFLLVACFLMLQTATAQSPEAFFKKADTFFSRHVSNGKVAYKAIHSSPDSLNELLEMAASIEIAVKDAALYQAFWINAYNLAVIKGIIDNYPTASPLDNPGFFDKTTYALGGKQITLNDIENKLLRAQFNDARVHFVLVCGALGCPPLIDKAYTPSTLENLLETQTRKALNDPNFIRVKKKRVELTEIMKWYREDFEKDGSTAIDFINTYREEKIATTSKVSYYPYNWKLNAQ